MGNIEKPNEQGKGKLAPKRQHVAEAGALETDRKQAEEEVRRARDDYLSITNLTGDIIVKVDAEGIWIFANDGACQFWGKPRRELIGRAFADYLHPDDHKITIAAVKQVQSDKMVKGLVNRQKTPKGWRTVEWNAAATIDGDGRYIGFQATGRDITERRKAEERIEHLNQLLRAIVSVNELIVREKDHDRLLKGICDALTRTHHYRHSWIALLDESGSITATAESGLGEEFLLMTRQWKRGKLPICVKRALRHLKTIVIRKTASSCPSCPLSHKYGCGSAFCVRLEYEERVYGFLSTCADSSYAIEKEEMSLLLRIAGDIAFALHDIKVEQQRHRAVNSLLDLTHLL